MPLGWSACYQYKKHTCPGVLFGVIATTVTTSPLGRWARAIIPQGILRGLCFLCEIQNPARPGRYGTLETLIPANRRVIRDVVDRVAVGGWLEMKFAA